MLAESLCRISAGQHFSSSSTFSAALRKTNFQSIALLQLGTRTDIAISQMNTQLPSPDMRSRLEALLGGRPSCNHVDEAASQLPPFSHLHIAWPQSSTDQDNVAIEDHNDVVSRILDDLLDGAANAELHFNLIDATFASLLCLHLEITDDPSKEVSRASDEAMKLLERLPPLPPMFDLSYAVWNGPGLQHLQDYFTSEAKRANVEGRKRYSPWEELEVVTRHATVVLKMAIIIVSSAADRYNIAETMSRFLNVVAELMDTIEERGRLARTSATLLERNIVRAYLWSTWTRCLQLFFWRVMQYHLAFGHDESWNRLIALRGTTLLMHPSIRATLYGWANTRVPYMCSWAFEVLRTDRCSLALDFRHFHQRYAELYATKTARCLWESDNSCDGGHPLNCGRFQDKRLVADEQSVHDCNNRCCLRICWSRRRYVAVSGAVAVGMSTTNGMVDYVEANERTMAISHVWSHGHGGRPDTGMNECLHKRFSHIARRYDCDSYWIDTLCIPDEHMLRKKAVGHINCIFAQSKVILVLDRDLMAIDVTHPTIERLESVLATFLVCDWNVRAWTMLEAMKGCHNLQLLCKDGKTLSLRDTLTHVHNVGRIDLAVLFLSTQHLLPSSTDPFRRASSRKALEFAGSLLSHRHATRKGDDIVIWSLISGIHVHFDAESLWRGRVDRKIRTGFLMSSAPRLHVPGFSWAPETPYVRRMGNSSYADLLGPFLVYDGEESEEALITSQGLYGPWLVYHFRMEDTQRFKEVATTMVSFTPEGQRVEQRLQGPGIRNRCWERAASLLLENTFVALLMPLQYGQTTAYQANDSRGESHGPVFAICTSSDGQYWKWREVNGWPDTMSRPEMAIEDIVIT
jgi:hypothetical protein